ncbi:MAG: hypothetical protein FWD62_10975 [Betaproteobacteria bacterium]|nr:hypothetical protein [Betaproteobacteria bacterium]
MKETSTENSPEEFGPFAEEVLNAGHLPQALLEQLEPRKKGRSVSEQAQAEAPNPEDFLAQIYRSQE